jgi:hypothetical protein
VQLAAIACFLLMSALIIGILLSRFRELHVFEVSSCRVNLHFDVCRDFLVSNEGIFVRGQEHISIRIRDFLIYGYNFLSFAKDKKLYCSPKMDEKMIPFPLLLKDTS